MALHGVTNLTVKRGSSNSGASLDAAWGFSGGESGEVSWVDEEWTFNASKNMSRAVTQRRGGGNVTGDIVWVRDQGTHFNATQYYDRQKYHPLTSGRYLKSVLVDIFHGTTLGNARHAKLTYTFKAPAVPTIGEPSYDEATGIVTFKVEAAADKDAYERYDTMYCITRQDSSNRGNTWKSEKIAVAWASTTESSATVSLDVADAQSVTYGQWVKVTCKAYSRGLAGDSATVTRVFYYAYPAQASITSIVASGMRSTDSVTVRLNTNASAAFPVDSVKLQRLRSSTITNADAAGLASGWQDVSGAVDNGACSGLVDYVVDAVPDVRTHTWYRLVTTHGSLVRRSVPVEATCLYRAKDASADDVVTFVSLAPGSDGQSLVARLAWNDDDSNTTQISWSVNEDAWESTQQPEMYDITWADPEPATGFDRSATVHIRGLEEGTAYYLRARRALKSGETESYGEWCYPAKESYPSSTAIAPTDVVLWAPATVERGSGIDCSWTYSGSPQTAWQILGKWSDDSVRELLSGDGSTGSVVIPATSVEGEDSIDLAVSVTSGGEWATSAYVPVTIADAPEIGMSVAETVSSQPLVISLTSTSPNANVMVRVSSRGVVTSTPDGEDVQADGDVVWSEVLTPAWLAVDDGWAASAIAPMGLALYEGAVYDVAVTATDPNGLVSDTVIAAFTVAWSHRAAAPSESTAIAISGLSATVTPSAPDGAAAKDVCDVYRLTCDGAYLIASDVPFGTSVTDERAPFSSSGSNAYRLCTRTADGDVAWADFEYELKHGSIRIEWGEESVELPYNITMSDSWDKGFEMRRHLDGTMAGYWDAGVSRKSSLSTDVVKVESRDKREALASLAKHAGPAFVRTPDGAAYPANVIVDSYGVSYDSQAVPVSVSCEEVAMTEEFMISPDDWGDGQ